MPLTGHWPLQEDSGGTAYDFSGNSYDGTINNASVNQAGILSTSSYLFDADGENITITDSGATSARNEWAVSFWVNVNAFRSNRQYIYTQGHVKQLIAVDDNTDTITMYYQDPNGYILNSPTITTDTWYHVGHRMSDSAGKMELYLNGQLEDTYSSSFNHQSGEITIGEDTRSGASSRYLDGTIADIRLWDHAVSPSVFQFLYESVANEANLETAEKTL